MNYIVLDLEWNQPMDPKKTVMEPVVLHSEIVQIGAVKLNESFNIVDELGIIIAPKHYKKMHWKVAKLTGITNERLRNGVPFPKAMERFGAWCGADCAFLTWGPDDIRVLRNNMLMHALDTNWLPPTYNVQVIFDHQVAHEHRQIALSRAMEMMDEPALEAHDALHDAKNTAALCRRLDMATGLAEYEQLQGRHGQDRPAARDSEEKTYTSRRAVFADPDTAQGICPVCGSPTVCSGITRQASDKYIAAGICPEGHELLWRFRTTKWPDGKITVSRLMFRMDEQSKAYYLSKKQQNEAAKRAYQKKKNLRIRQRRKERAASRVACGG